ncbi:MAG: hypothetical protein A2901_07295 [Elusimicrobia bacterium RIFCSPLOWO2_01_FULL_54_10]|nr:MAG: hypothetical protein A2901_07295 [Elusimicrobia bacterium RIFCSPLOWO2_01_FULL_54_10]
MPSILPRISAIVEPPIFKAVERLAKRDGVSLSQKARDLLLEALELFEDEVLEAKVIARMRNKAPSIPQKYFWQKRKVK